MGSSTKTTQNQSSQTSPWTPAQPYLTDLLGQTQTLYNQNANNGVLPGALKAGQNQIIANAQGGATTAAADAGLSQVGNLIGSGGDTATGTAAIGGINSALGGFNTGNSTLSKFLTPIADGSQIGANNGAFQTALQASLDKARDTIGSQFAGAGRYGSASMGNAQAKTLGDVAAGATASQYNQDKANQLAAIGQLTGVNAGGLSGNISGNTATAGIGQNSVSNLLSGVGALPTLNTAQNLDANNLVGVGNQSWANLDNLASILSSVGGMGGQSVGTGTSTQSTSGAGSVFGGILGLLGGGANLATGIKGLNFFPKLAGAGV